ncbi:MAG: acetolactate synthase [Pyrinomonadaceae bacterium]|nr:acetolactate synthase [Phycisphaerales bacterium]
MSQMPVSMETTQGYAPPSVTQFSVFLDNRVGKLHELVRTFDEANVQICAFSVHDASDHAVVRLIAHNAQAAKNLLTTHQDAFTETSLLVVELTKGHTLERMCLYLLGAELNIRFAYPLMLRPNGSPTIALAVDDLTLAGQILRRKEFRLLGEGDLPRNNL